MVEISARHSQDLELTLFTVNGQVSADDLIAAMKQHYGRHPTSIAIWDLSGSDLSRLDMAALVKVSDCAKRFARYRKEPRTLVVVNREQEQPLVRLYEEISGVRGSPISYGLHQSLAAAYGSLGLEDPFAEQRKSA